MRKYFAVGIFVVIAVGLLLFFVLNPTREELVEVEPEPIPDPVLLFGFPVDSFQVESATIERNQNLSDILLKKNISYQDIDLIAKKSQPVFDVRRMRQGHQYHFFMKRDSVSTPSYFIYEIDNKNYVVYELLDSMNIYKREKPIHTVLRTVSGTIKSSLWNTMIENGLNPLLAIELSEIYAWSIDFFGIQRNDKFRIIYDEVFVDSVSIGIGNIYACQFQHMKQDFYAFLFEQDSAMSYFDEKGKSLKKAFLKAPLTFSRISSKFSNARFHPVLKISRPHHGIDYAAPTGTPVVSIGDGVVTRKGYQQAGGGNYLYIKHNSVYTTCYMHLHGFAKGIAIGSRVRQNQVIGYVGSTGLATGPHLDFRVFRNGSPMDPLKVEAPPVEPVHERRMPEFTHLKDSLIRQIAAIPFDE